MQHLRSSVELQGASTAHSPQKRSSTPGSGSRRSPSFYRSSMLRGECGSGLYRPEGAPLWAWILLWALVAPGACGLTAEHEELIVELHNYYRGQVSPSASAMMPLKWDNNLRILAATYATKCTWVHNPDLTDTGENLFVSTGALDIREAMEQWFMENIQYNYYNNSCEGVMCGHYTQMVWADTHRVGCEVHSCATMEGLDLDAPAEFLVCNYYPGGNYDEQKPYEEGEWCSRCPDELQKCENSLCVPDVEEGEEEDEEDTNTLWATQPTADDKGATVSLPSDTATRRHHHPRWTESQPPTPSSGTPLESHSSQAEVDLPTPTPGVKEETEAPKKTEIVEEIVAETETETDLEKEHGNHAKSRATSCCKYDNFLVTTFLCLVGALALRL